MVGGLTTLLLSKPHDDDYVVVVSSSSFLFAIFKATAEVTQKWGEGTSFSSKGLVVN